MISEKTTHDTKSVHLFNYKLMAYLKEKFAKKNIQKIYYFSNGAALQYKNKYNFVNSALHQKDFGIKAEWVFFATSHGKGACDGIGRTVKRHAYQISLQRNSGRRITTAKDLFLLARNFFKNIYFDFCSVEEYNIHEENIKTRFQTVLTIKNTCQFHHFKPINATTIECKPFSGTVINNLFKAKKIKIYCRL